MYKSYYISANHNLVYTINFRMIVLMAHVYYKKEPIDILILRLLIEYIHALYQLHSLRHTKPLPGHLAFVPANVPAYHIVLLSNH